MRPEKKTYPDYYENYIRLVIENDLQEALSNNQKEIKTFVSAIPAARVDHTYAPGKWTVKQVLNHIADTERVMAYRALRFARKDPKQPLPFDENLYAANPEINNRSVGDILEELITIRLSTISLFRSFSDSSLLSVGNSAAGDTTVIALGYMIVGHAKHHLNVIAERYLKAV